MTGISHNSCHKLPFTCRGLESLSRFPLPEARPVRKPQRTAGAPAASGYNLHRAPKHRHSSQGLPYKFSNQKSLIKKKNQPKTPQFNSSKTSHVKSRQRTILLGFTHFLPNVPGRCQRLLQPQRPSAVRCRARASGNGCVLCHAETLWIIPCCPFFLPPLPLQAQRQHQPWSGPYRGSYTTRDQTPADGDAVLPPQPNPANSGPGTLSQQVLQGAFSPTTV